MRVLFFLLFFSSGLLRAQDISIKNGWKFKTGDDAEWAKAGFNDSDWKPIEIGKSWENQGYDRYDGFAWYRLHVVIPSSVRDKSFLKEKIEFDLGKIDDGDEVYLNGSLIGKNAGKGGDIKDGPYDLERVYRLNVKDPRIFWDKENIIAVRVWDHGGDGGMYEGKYGISALDLTSYIDIDAWNADFKFPANKKISKKITLRSTSETYDFTGKLQIRIEDPSTGKMIFRETIGADFANNRPFVYTYTASLPENKSYQATYTFVEDRSGKIVSSKEGIPFILTPSASAKPRINGSSIYGVRPGSLFIYRIPATGQKPLRLEVSGLPEGLSLDKITGIIKGSISKRGDFKLLFTVKNQSGEATKTFVIRCGDQIGLTPALGWNSWNCWGLSVSDEKVRKSASAMVEQLSEHGWSYINIDDGWQAKRDAAGNILPNEKFPDMKALGEYIHGLGLKLGIYSSPGPQTCGGYTGSYQHEEQDIKTYSDWGIDYLKYDWCSYGQIAPPNPSLEELKKPYQIMEKFIKNSNRDILFSLCQYGMGDVWTWGATVGGNSWRTTGDITDTWASLSAIGFRQYVAAPHTAPGHFNDPDMLIVGKVGWGPSLHPTRLSPDEQYTHISLWCLLSSPLLIGCDMSQLDVFTLNLLTNDEVLAIDQDAAAKPATKVYDKNFLQVWTKELGDGSKAIGIFNLSDSGMNATIDFETLKLAPRQKLRDLWRQKDLGTISQKYADYIASHGVLLLKSTSITQPK
jgi:alpha-galactosidase